MARFIELSNRASTAYAELFEAARGLELSRSVAALSGGFSAKTVRGKRYWYYQYREIDGVLRQLYVGPDDERSRQLIARIKQREPYAQVDAMARAAIELGCEPVAPAHFQIIRRIAEYGFFRAGGVLVGTHAFIALAPALGVRWSESPRTEDVDFAHPGKHLEIALPANLAIDMRAAVESLELGFIPTSAFVSTGSDATFVSAKHGLRIDFLTTRKRTNKPVHVDNLNVAMQPLPFMELLLEHPTQVAVMSRNGAGVVNVPDPINLALHKLIIAMERSPAWRVKSVKDLEQAAALLEVAARFDEDSLRSRWTETLARGPSWRKKLLAGRKTLEKRDSRAVALLPV